MHPIYLFDGLERYLLVPAGSDLASSHDPVAPTRARAILEAALRRRDPRLMRGLRAVLRWHGTDGELASRQLALFTATGAMGGNLVLVREHAEPPRLDSRAPVLESLAPEPLPPEPIYEDGPEDEPPPARTSIRVSVFFDGTANNRANTQATIDDTSVARHNADETSFQNDFTNVSRLETLCIGDDTFAYSYSIYVEGIGTTNRDSDTNYGLAEGMGDTGVVAKVRSGYNELLGSIAELGIARGTIIERLHLDAFGFSRGSAAARYFVHYVLHSRPLRSRIVASGHPVEQLEINFIGLFDTVASYGPDHTNDTSDLHLDAIRVARKVVHLAAAEEHRENFPLTNIHSAIAAGVGIEIHLPGVHSDIGGGYTELSDERDLQILDLDVLYATASVEARFERERTWLIDQGWYLASEIAAVNGWNELNVTRRDILNHYNRIPLKHMATFAGESGLGFEPIADSFPVPRALAEIEGIIDAHVADHVAGTTTSLARHWIYMRTPAFQHLRHGYLHFSAHYGDVGMGPHWSRGDVMTGSRERVVYAG